MSGFCKTVTQLPVRPGDLDSVGHVNNARVLEFLEHGRWDWLRKNNLGRGTRVIPVVVRIEADYRAEIPWGDVRVESDMAQDEDLTFKAIFNQFIYVGSSHEPAVKAVVHVAFIAASERSVCTVADFIDDASIGAEQRNFRATNVS
jgi:YbgC/YbaW family acyl-CoA thioester hydrolase